MQPAIGRNGALRDGAGDFDPPILKTGDEADQFRPPIAGAVDVLTSRRPDVQLPTKWIFLWSWTRYATQYCVYTYDKIRKLVTGRKSDFSVVLPGPPFCHRKTRIIPGGERPSRAKKAVFFGKNSPFGGQERLFF